VCACSLMRCPCALRRAVTGQIRGLPTVRGNRKSSRVRPVWFRDPRFQVTATSLRIGPGDSSTQSGLAHADETAQVSASTICPDRSPPGRLRRVVGPPAAAARHQAESASCPGRWTRRPETGIPSGASAAQHPAPPTTQGFVTVSQRSGQESGWPHSACQAPLPHPIPVTRSSPRWMTSGCNSP